jgi:hypothetical protein
MRNTMDAANEEFMREYKTELSVFYIQQYQENWKKSCR